MSNDILVRAIISMKIQNDNDMMRNEDFDEGILDGWDGCLSEIYGFIKNEMGINPHILERKIRIEQLQEQIEELEAEEE